MPLFSSNVHLLGYFIFGLFFKQNKDSSEFFFFFTPINIVTVVNRRRKHTGNRVGFILLPKKTC